MTRPFHVLLIDDNATDLLLATEAFLELDATMGVDTFASGQHALDHLRATPQDALPEVVASCWLQDCREASETQAA